MEDHLTYMWKGIRTQSGGKSRQKSSQCQLIQDKSCAAKIWRSGNAENTVRMNGFICDTHQRQTLEITAKLKTVMGSHRVFVNVTSYAESTDFFC